MKKTSFVAVAAGVLVLSLAALWRRHAPVPSPLPAQALPSLSHSEALPPERERARFGAPGPATPLPSRPSSSKKKAGGASSKAVTSGADDSDGSGDVRNYRKVFKANQALYEAKFKASSAAVAAQFAASSAS